MCIIHQIQHKKFFKMWNQSSLKEVKSKYFEGISLFQNAIDSMYGLFMKEIQKIQIDIKDLDLKTPKIIVIGCESSGKSSLLENIVKCQLFPRNATFGTKQPIHLILRPVSSNEKPTYKLTYLNKVITTNKKNIYKEIEEIMNDIKDDIVENEILIEITEVDMIEFEFYDLPGIRAYPQNLETKTKNLVKTYLSQENVIPICVIPSTTPRITSYVPLALIKDFSKEKDTFICLTMCDRLQSENIEDLLVNRIIGTTDEFKLEQFAGITAIINRSHKNVVSLVENDVTEYEWFNENIYKNIPKDYPTQNKNKLIKHTTIHNLVKNLNINYQNFMKVNWIPKTMTKISAEIQEKKNELYDIGFDPTDEYKKMEFQQYFKTKTIKKIFKHVIQNDVDDPTIENVHSFSGDHIADITPEVNLIKITDLVCIDSDCPVDFKPVRFTELYKKISIYINTAYEKQVPETYNKYHDMIMYDFLSLTPDNYDSKQLLFCSNLKRNISEKLYEDLLRDIETFPTFINLKEDDSCKNLRVSLNQKIKDLNSALEKVADLQKI